MPQLDESKAYEEMVEALTSKNLELGERCGELEATIGDLESSVELSEELEVQQAEELRELQVSFHNICIDYSNNTTVTSSVLSVL